MSDFYESGDKVRRAVLGDDYVDRSVRRADERPFFKPLNESVTALAWGQIWDRPGLDRKHRSLITVSILLALGRRHELELHLRGALRNGWTAAELQEVILHAGCYAGWPAAVEGYRVAADIVEAFEKERGDV